MRSIKVFLLSKILSFLKNYLFQKDLTTSARIGLRVNKSLKPLVLPKLKEPTWFGNKLKKPKGKYLTTTEV